MSKISIYEVVPVPKLADKLVGTSVGGDPEDITYNFTLSELLNLFIPNIPGNTLQGVLDFGNTATQDIILNGTIFTTYLEVTDTATILDSFLTGETHITGGLYDRLNSVGTAGQVLRSTGTQVEWYSVPTVIPDLQQVLTSGNTAVNNIILTGNLSANNAALLTSTISTSLTLLGTLRDGLSSVGANNQVLSSNVTGVRWVNLPVYSATSPLLYNSGTGVFSIQQSSASQDGYLSSADWITFDGKQTAISLTTTGNSGASTLVGATINVPNYTLAGLGGVPQTRTLTINGVTYNLSADRSWTLATGVSSVSATTPLFSTGGVNPDISIQQSSSSLDGYLSNVDWLTFNSKQPAGNYITSLTGEATAVGPGAAAVILSNAAVIGKLLTGLSITGSAITSSDSILTAFGKVQNQINGLIGGVQFQGVWNAATNTPTLVSSVGTQGYYYIVDVAGNTNLNGITDWQIGDWAIFNGSTWNKVDNTDLVTSVNGQVGAVSLTTDNIPEGATNLYYLDSRARAALSFAAGSGAYNSTTGVITIPTDNSQILNGAGYITLVSLSATSPLSYNNTTGAFSIQVANTTQNGYLSSTDWNTFNGKQDYLNGTGLVKSVAGVISYITDNSANWNTAYNDSIVSAAVTGTATKTLTLNQQDGGTITASWSDIDTGLTSVGVSMPSAFTVTNSPLTANGTIAITGSGNTLQYVDGTGALQSFPSLTGYVPYTGATANVNLGIYNLTAASLIKNGGTSGQFLKADGSVDSSAYIVLGSLSATAPLSYNNTTGVFTISQSGASTNGYLSSTDWNTFNSKEPAIIAGTTLQYYRGDKTFQTLNTTVVPEGTNLYYLDSRARAAVSLTTTGSSGASTYNSTTGVFNIPDYGAALTGYVPTSRTLNINGTSYDLSADRSWSVGTVTSVAALTIGTTGTDLSSTVATNTTTPVITLNVPTASAANRGALSSADWSTFNTKVGGVTATTPLFSSGGSTPNLTIQQSSGSQDGYLSSTDWTTFNNKQAAGNYITSLTGEATATGPGAAAVTLDNAAVTGKILTGVNITGGTVLSTDTILAAFGKLQNQVNGLIGGSIYQGTWNASTNTPTLTSSVGTQGYYYIVSVAGTTNLDGITDWFVGDWAIFNGGVWQQVDNTDAVVSVNGQTGAVSLTTDNIPEGTTNLYYTDTRARASLSFVAGSGAYNSSTGAITIPTNTSQLTNGANFITLASLSGTAPISYNSGTGAISITQSGTASNGYLSSTDWNTFNNKQAALTNPVLASGTWTSNYIPKINGTYTLTNSLLYDGGSSIGVNTNAPHDSTQFKLDVNGGLIVKNTSGTTAQFVLIDANPAGGGNNAFVQQTVGGTLTAAWSQIQTYYGLAIAAGALRLQPTAGQVLVGTATASAFMVDINGTLRTTGQLTLGSTITNGTYTYTLPGATGTLALVGGSGVGTVTSVSFTLGGSGTDLNSSVANSTTTPAITLNVPTASATNRGALSAADWTTFNNKQATLSLTTTGTSGAATLVGATLNIPNYGSALTGYVPYTGATANVDLGAYFLKTSKVYNTFDWLKEVAFGYAGWTTLMVGINSASTLSLAFNVDLSTNPSPAFNGNGTEYFWRNTGTFKTPNTANNGYNTFITWDSVGNISFNTIIAGTWNGNAIADAYISSAATWNAKQNAITLTTTGTSGAATLVGATLNIPQYSTDLSGYVTLNTVQTITASKTISVNQAAAGFISNNANTTDQAGVAQTTWYSEKLRLGVSFANASNGIIASNGADTGLAFMTHNTVSGWVERFILGSDGNATFTQIVSASSLRSDYITIVDNQINSGRPTNGYADLWVNYLGYNNGATQFRDFRVGDGKGTQLVKFMGSTRDVVYSVISNVYFNYSSTDTDQSYAALIKWNGLQLGNNGNNDLVAGHSAAGGYFNIWVNNINRIGTPNGTKSATFFADGTTQFFGALTGSAGSKFTGDFTITTATNGQLYINHTNTTVTRENDIYFQEAAANKALIRNIVGGDIFQFYSYEYGIYPLKLLATTGAALFISSVTASSFIKTGGTSVQYLMADGSVSSGFTDTDTLAIVTARGASTTVRTTFTEVGASREGSDSVAAGPWFRWTNLAESRQMLTQLNASNGLTWWGYNGSSWIKRMTLSQETDTRLTLSSVGNNPRLVFEQAGVINRGAASHEMYIGEDTDTGGFNIRGSGTVTVGGQIDMALNRKIRVQNPSMYIDGLTPSYFGYSSGYGILLVGHPGNVNRSIAFGVDVTGNPSGAFSGLGSEYVWKNSGSFITPNAANNGYNTLLSWNSSGQITITGATTIGSVDAGYFYTNDTRYIANQIQSGYNTNAEDSDIWINYTGYQGGATRFRDFRVGNGKQTQIMFVDGSTGVTAFSYRVTASNNQAGAATVSTSNSNSTDDAGMSNLNFDGNRIRLGVLPSDGAYGCIGSGGAASTGLAFVTHNGSAWGEGMRLTPARNLIVQGDVTAYSDASVKNNIRPIKNVLNRIQNSRGILYDRIDTNTKDNIGFIAQELEKQFPELIITNENGTKAVKYQNAVAILFEAVKEQQKQIDELKKQVA